MLVGGIKVGIALALSKVEVAVGGNETSLVGIETAVGGDKTAVGIPTGAMIDSAGFVGTNGVGVGDSTLHPLNHAITNKIKRENGRLLIVQIIGQNYTTNLGEITCAHGR